VADADGVAALAVVVGVVVAAVAFDPEPEVALVPELEPEPETDPEPAVEPAVVDVAPDDAAAVRADWPMTSPTIVRLRSWLSCVVGESVSATTVIRARSTALTASAGSVH